MSWMGLCEQQMKEGAGPGSLRSSWMVRGRAVSVPAPFACLGSMPIWLCKSLLTSDLC